MSPAKMITWNGKTQSAGKWEKELGLARGTINTRIKRGYPMKKVMAKGYLGSRKKREKSMKDCCLPDCQKCPFEDCINNSGPKSEETEILKRAMEKLPDISSGFDRTYRLNSDGKVRR